MNTSSQLLALGINHKTAPLSLREECSFTAPKQKEVLHNLISRDDIDGGVILSTCNRVELYLSSRSTSFTPDRLKWFFPNLRRVNPDYILPHMYCLKNSDAVRHLYRVAAGLDSQLLGENEILGQVKKAYATAKDAGASDDTIEWLFEEAIKIGKKVRRETQINRGSLSLSSMAIKLVEKTISLHNKTILLVGVNKINEQIAKYLHERNIHTVIVANRTYEKAVNIARYLGGKAIHFDQFKQGLHKVDVIISSTAAPHLVLKKEELQTALNKRNRRVLLIDLAVPRDIDPEIRKLNDVTLYNLDDFNRVIEENICKKKEEAAKADRLISQAVEKTRFVSKPLTSAYQPNASTIHS